MIIISGVSVKSNHAEFNMTNNIIDNDYQYHYNPHLPSLSLNLLHTHTYSFLLTVKKHV